MGRRKLSRLLPVLTGLLLTACATEERPAVDIADVSEESRVDDYIAVAELPEVPAIRSLRTLHHRIITDTHVLVYDNQDTWLLRFARPCRRMHEKDVEPDVRYERNVIRSRFDTFRGCKIESIFEVDEAQAGEIRNLG